MTYMDMFGSFDGDLGPLGADVGPIAETPSTDWEGLRLQLSDQALVSETPRTVMELPNGQMVEVTGDVERCAQFTDLQGNNPYGYQGTCGLASCADVLQQFEIPASEATVVEHAVERGECNEIGAPELRGGTTGSDQARVLSELGLPAQYLTGGTIESLATNVDEGRGIIVEVNAGELWNDASHYGDGSANHAIVVTGVQRDLATGEVQGFYINDSGSPPHGHAAQFIDTTQMNRMWVDAGGALVVTSDCKA